MTIVIIILSCIDLFVGRCGESSDCNQMRLASVALYSKGQAEFNTAETFILEIKNQTDRAQSVDCRPSIARKVKDSDGLPRIEAEVETLKRVNPKSWTVELTCEVAPTNEERMESRTNIPIDRMEIPAGGTQYLKVTVPGGVFSPGKCTVQARLLENEMAIAVSNVVTVNCEKKRP